MRKRERVSDLPVIDGYTIEEQIGSGGFSKVYRALQHRLDRQVAIKILNTGFADERQQRTFERECKVMGQLSTHPNIVTVFDSALTERGQPCIIMELYGSTYREMGVMPIPDVVSVGAKVADALQAIHDAGIVHRDIKPHNIFLSDRGEPAIGDFGISSLEDERTITGSTGFSINYAAPEVFEEGGAGSAGDIYALGATLYHLASGQVPFPHTGDPGDRLRATIHRIIGESPPSLQLTGAAEGFDRLLRRCMAKAAADRPPTASSIAEELRQLTHEIGAGPAPATGWRPNAAPTVPSSPPSDSDRGDDPITDNITFVRERSAPRDLPETGAAEPGPPDSPDGRRRAVIIGGAIAAVVVAVGLVLALTGDGGSDEPQADPTPAPTAEVRQLPQAPTDLVVTATGGGTFELSWAPPSNADNATFEIFEVSSGNTETATASPYTWTIDTAPERACFEVRTSFEGISLSAPASACSDD